MIDSINLSLKKKQKVVVIASGDPGYFGIARYLVTHLGKEKIEIIPNITTFQSAFAKIKESWDDAFLLSLHGRPLPALAPLLKRHRKMGVLTDSTNTPSVIAKNILSEDRNLHSSTVFILEQLGSKQERIHRYLLRNVVHKSFASLSAMILFVPDKICGAEEENVQLGISDTLFSRQGGLITKSDIRIFTVAKLCVPKRGVLWDVGSGSGSVAIEAALLSPELRVFAIEKEQRRIKDIEVNSKRFSVTHKVTPVRGEAPGVLKGLPKPHRIFIGGTAGQLKTVLRYCARVLLPAGRIVINATTVETVVETLSFFKQRGWVGNASLVNIAKLKIIGDKERLQPLNPVFIIEGHASGKDNGC